LVELGRFSELRGSRIDSVDGLGDVITIPDSSERACILLYGRKIEISRESKILSDEAVIYGTYAKLFGVDRKLPEHLVDKCIEMKIYPRYNYIKPERLIPWVGNAWIDYHTWQMYDESEKQLMRKNGFWTSGETKLGAIRSNNLITRMGGVIIYLYFLEI
jgi:hypothetical protein